MRGHGVSLNTSRHQAVLALLPKRKKKHRAGGNAGPSGAPSMGGKKSAPVHHNPIQALRFRF
jgi:hypothetical protein